MGVTPPLTEAPMSVNKGNKPVRPQDLESSAAIRTHSTGPRTIERTDSLRSGEKLEKKRITLPPLNATRIAGAASNANVSPPKRMPDFAFAVIQLAAAREMSGSDKLKALATQVKEQLENIDILLDLSNELISLPDQDFHNVSNKMRGLLGKLEIHKIQIWKGDDKISKEKLAEMKAQISAQIDKLRTSLQTTISTEIQPETNNLQAIMNIVQQIIQSDARLKRKTTEVPR